jgi:hypothetical protein
MASLVKTFPQAFLKISITRYRMLGETAATSSLMFCFKSTVVLGFFPYAMLLRYPRGRSIVTRNTHSDKYLNADEISTELQQQNCCFRKSPPQRKPDVLQTQRSMATEML